MRIDGITCCVGEKYVAQLIKSLKKWLDTLDSLTIVTAEGDASIQPLVEHVHKLPQCRAELKIRTTNVFYEHGASFNKAAALCEAYAFSNPTDWVLHFDSDIIPPTYWRDFVEKGGAIEAGNLYGAFRYDEEGRRLDEAPLFPYGYFHLWHSRDIHALRWPIFETWHPHAGNYDSHFAEQWPMSNRRELGFSVIHQGEPRQNWFGPKGSAEAMQELHKLGLLRVRRLAQQGTGTISIPDPLIRLYLLSPEHDPVWAQGVVNLCAQYGPFLAIASPGMTVLDKLQGKSLQQYRAIDPSVSLAQVKELLDKCLAT